MGDVLMSYLTVEQVRVLLLPINGNRVSSRDGQHHLEAYDVRAHLNRVIGFGLWSGDVTDITLLFEAETTTKNGKPAYAVAYRCTYRLTIMGPDGFPLCTYTETAAGDALMPDYKRADAHDFAIKTAESQALKRCAINLGDQFGLSLYNGNNPQGPLVGKTLVQPSGVDTSTEDGHMVDSHVDGLAPEDASPPPDSPPTADGEAPVPPPATPVAGGGDRSAPARPAPGAPGVDIADDIRDRALNIPESVTRPKAHLTKLLLEANREGVLGAFVGTVDGESVRLEDLLQARIREVAAA